MEFFIPFAKSKEDEQQVYASIKQFLSEVMQATFSDDRIMHLDYKHDKKDYTVEVGKPHPYNHEDVIAILYEPARELYHVCTPSRGVVRREAFLVGKNEVRHRMDFDNLTA